MPTYQYSCTDCGHAFDQFQSFTDDALTECPRCQGRLRKLFNAVGVVFKGSGFYRNDSRADSRTASGKSDGSKESGESADSKPDGGSTKTDTKPDATKQDSKRQGAEPSRVHRRSAAGEVTRDGSATPTGA